MLLVALFRSAQSAPVGSRFVTMPGLPEFSDLVDKPVSSKSLLLRSVTLKSVRDDGKAVFKFDDGRTLTTHIKYPADTPGLIAIQNDAETARLDRKYAGAKVWSYGTWRLVAEPVATNFSGGVDRDPWQPTVITHVYRLKNHKVNIGIYPAGSFDVTDFESKNPLLVVYRIPGKVHIALAGGGDVKDPSTMMVASTYGGFCNFFDGDWQIQRTFSLSPPPKAFAHAIKKRTVQKGMSHTEVAWILGWPPERKTLVEMRKMDVWAYPAQTPFQSKCWFRGDRLIRYDPPGRLP